MKRLYMCNTPYHLFSTLIKEIKLDNDVDIVLSDKTLGYEKLELALKKSNLVNNVFIIEESKFHLPKINPSYWGNITQNKKVREAVEPYIDFDVRIYDDIYMYHDFTRFGCYIIASSIKYNLIEDGLDYFRVFDKFINIDLSLRRRILSFLNLNIFHYGQSRYCKSIEVNSIKDIRIPLKKVIEVPRKQLISSLTNEEKKRIYDIFMGDKEVTTNNEENNKILILTEPLFKDCRVSSEEEQLRVYRDLIDTYNSEKYTVYIKPHPRDMLDYSKLNREHIIIDRDFPVEILNFNENIKFNKAVAITSASIDGIKFVDNKIKVGFNYLESDKKD